MQSPEVNSEQASLESLAETCERLCGPDVDRDHHSSTTVVDHHCGAKTAKRCECDFALCDLYLLELKSCGLKAEGSVHVSTSTPRNDHADASTHCRRNAMTPRRIVVSLFWFCVPFS